MDFKSIINAFMTGLNGVSRLAKPSASMMAVGIFGQLIKILKTNFKDDIRKFVQKMVIGFVLACVAVFAVIATLKSGEEIIRPLPNGPWIILASYFLITVLSVAGLYYIFNKKDKLEEAKIKAEELADRQNDFDLQGTLLTALNNFINGVTQSYNDKRREETESSPESKDPKPVQNEDWGHREGCAAYHKESKLAP